jgi:hypothetical protein
MLLAPNICVAYFAAGPYFTDAWTAAGLVLAALGWALLFTHIVRQVCAGGSADSNTNATIRKSSSQNTDVQCQFVGCNRPWK